MLLLLLTVETSCAMMMVAVRRELKEGMRRIEMAGVNFQLN